MKWQKWIKSKKELEKSLRFYLRKEILIKISPNKNLAKAHLEKAFHNLELATFILEKPSSIGDGNYNDGAIIFSYYAMYQAALGLLSFAGYKSETHSATICILCSFLDEKYVKMFSVMLDKKNIEEIGIGQERREKASYSPSVDFEKKLALMSLEDARDFVNKIQSVMEGAKE